MGTVKTKKKVPKKVLKKPNKVSFDPTIISKDSNQAANVVWTSQNVEIAVNNIKNGIKTKHPFWENNPLHRKGDIVFEPTKEEMDEYFECMLDLHYFAEEHCKLKRGDGEVGSIKLRDYQDIQLRNFLDDPRGRHIMLWSRQAAKTTTTCIFILWNMTFKNNRITAILGNRLATSVEVLNKIKEIYELLPFYLQAGIVAWNEKTIAFDNKCVILARPCTKDALNGLSVYILYIDEFAFCFKGDKEQQREFLANAQPTLSSFKDSKLIITSTPNGKDLFCEIYDRAEQGLNTFNPTKIYWWNIPNRDSKWAKNMVAEIGIDKFKVQYELSFDVSMDKLLNVETMQRLDREKENFVDAREYLEHGFLENYIVDGSKCAFRCSEKISKCDLKNDFFITTSDLAEGLGGDSDATTQHTFRLNHKMKGNQPYIYFEQVMVFESNVHDLHNFSSAMCDVHTSILNQDNTRYLFENNKYGDLHRLQILNIGDEDFERELYPETFFKFRRSADSNRMSVGLLTNRAIKKLAVKGFKKGMEGGLYDVTDTETITQILNFQKDDKGNYQAEIGHDDLVTPIINMSWLVILNPMALRELIEDYFDANDLKGSKIMYATDLSDASSRYVQRMQSDM